MKKQTIEKSSEHFDKRVICFKPNQINPIFGTIEREINSPLTGKIALLVFDIISKHFVIIEENDKCFFYNEDLIKDLLLLTQSQKKTMWRIQNINAVAPTVSFETGEDLYKVLKFKEYFDKDFTMDFENKTQNVKINKKSNSVCRKATLAKSKPEGNIIALTSDCSDPIFGTIVKARKKANSDNFIVYVRNVLTNKYTTIESGSFIPFSYGAFLEIMKRTITDRYMFVTGKPPGFEINDSKPKIKNTEKLLSLLKRVDFI